MEKAVEVELRHLDEACGVVEDLIPLLVRRYKPGVGVEAVKVVAQALASAEERGVEWARTNGE